MLYAVTAHFVANVPQHEIASLVERVVLPSLKVLVDRVQAGEALGGAVAGQRVLTFIMEAASNEDADRRLKSLPFWGLHNWEVVPLVPFEHVLHYEAASLPSARDDRDSD